MKCNTQASYTKDVDSQVLVLEAQQVEGHVEGTGGGGGREGVQLQDRHDGVRMTVVL